MPAEKPRIQILCLENSPEEIAHIRDLLAREGLNAVLTPVAGGNDFEASLTNGTFDVILTDYTVSDYDGLSVLRFAKKQQPAVPVIVFSGSQGEEVGVRCIKEGATDFLPKNRPDLIGPAIKCALDKAADERNRRQSEMALRESEERFRQLAERIGDVFWSATPDGQKLNYVSPAFERIWERRMDELYACPSLWRECIAPEDRPRVLDALQRLAAGVDYEIEYRILLPDGRTRWILDRGFALRDTDERVYRTVGVATDITGRKLAEKDHRRSEERLAAIFNASPIAIAFGTLDGRLIDVNPEFCNLFGCSRDEVIGQNVAGSFPWSDSDTRERALAKLSKKKVLRNFEAKFRQNSGRVRSGLVSMEMLRLGHEPMLLTMIVDVTDQKAMEAQLHRAQRLESVGQLTTGIAHDMNNILAPIMMSAPLLRMGLPPESAEKILSAIEISAQKGAALARQLLSFGRGVEGARRLVNVAAIIKDIAKFSRQTFPRNISIGSEVAKGLWSVHGDATQLNQVLLNLCVNARDALPEGGHVVISAENVGIDELDCAAYADAKPGRYVLIRVADDGEGIAPENMDRIFDPFFSTKDVEKGTGLGLSTALGIVKSHGGFIRLHSEPGQGATFEIYLPADTRPVSAPPFEAPAAAFVRGRGELIMIVDDEEPVRTVLRDTFLQCNYRVITAEDGVEATAAFVANPEVRLVLTDLDMPLIDGLSLARVLHRLNPAVKFVISTGLAGNKVAGEHREEFNSLGVTTVLTKPYTGETILRAVQAALA